MCGCVTMISETVSTTGKPELNMKLKGEGSAAFPSMGLGLVRGPMMQFVI